MDFPDPKATGHEQGRRVVPWMVGGLAAVALLVIGIPVCLYGGVLLLFVLSEPSQFTVVNHHPEMIRNVRLIAVYGEEDAEIINSVRRLRPGVEWSSERRYSREGFDLWVEYHGPDGLVVHDEVFWVDSNETGEMEIHLGGPNAPYAR